MEIKNLKKAATRIKRAIKNKENIILYSDSDLDGITSLLILEETIKNLKGNIILKYFYDRGKEGCGLNDKSLKLLKNYPSALMILTDCGIANFSEIDEANKLGFEVIVIDHHKILDNKTPKASIIIDPKQAGDEYPFKDLAACGLSFRLSQLLLGKNMSKQLEQSFLELAALGTIADMMPRIADNEEIIRKGAFSIPNSNRPALKVAFSFFRTQSKSDQEAVARIAQLVQMTDVEDHISKGYLFLSSPDEKTAEKHFKDIYKKFLERKELLANLTDDFIKVVESKDSDFIFEGSKEIPPNLTGVLAARLFGIFKKPTFIYYSGEKMSRGSARVPKGVDSVEAMTSCKSLLDVYGGHAPASGFSIKNENLKKFKECLEDYLNSHWHSKH